MIKKKIQKKYLKIFCPETLEDLQDIVAILLEMETSIIINMSKLATDPDKLVEIIRSVASFGNLRMSIGIKILPSNVCVCWSERIN